MDDMTTTILITVVAAVVVGIICGIVFFLLGIKYRKKVAEAEIGSAEEEAKRIISESAKTAEVKKKEALIEARDEIHRARNESEKELRERRSEVQRQERRIQQKEETLDRKIENLERKDDQLQAKIREVEKKLSEADEVKQRQFDMLEKISGFSVEQAKEYLLQNLEDELTHEKAVKINNFEQQLKDEAEQRARELISMSIQRCAADHVAEATVSVVSLPNDEMKGRIIGREGRNIRALETLTGVDLIIDDTPEAITLSSFDPVRREIARITLEKLIADGRIHPARIEEMVEKSKREVEQKIKQEGERAVLEASTRHPPRACQDPWQAVLPYQLWTECPQPFSGSLPPGRDAGCRAGEDEALARRAGLLHDIGKALDHEYEGSHIQIGVEVARRYRENADVVHAIEAHHGDVEARTVIACLVQAADAISAARPGARRENLENYIKRLEKLEEIANSFDGVEKSYAIQAGREIRIMLKPEVVSDDQLTLVARDIVKKIESELDYPGQIKVHVIW